MASEKLSEDSRAHDGEQAVPVETLYDALCASGEEHVQSDRFPDAVLSFVQALDADPSGARAWGGLGAASFRQGCLNASKAFFEMAVRLDPADEDSAMNWAEASPSTLSDEQIRRALLEMGVADDLASRAVAARSR
jgi:cytochrome c-type biogenesis protein CcmH/NrfG